LEPLWKEFSDSEQLQWNYDNDNFEALWNADIMITDFSGIIFDYALVFGKPIIYADTSFDPAPYDAAWIEEPLWRFEVLKELGAPLQKEDFPRMRELIDELLQQEQGKEAREKVRSEAWQCIGESAKLTVDYMIHKYEELLSEKEKKC
jgi:CDP-glycerol glycerophosphotransferase (TagB/SpsB family)